jgi:hypothetical protein
MEAIIGVIINALIGPVAEKVLEWHKDDNKTAVSKEQLAAELKKVMTLAATDAYKSGMDNAFKIYDSFQQSLRASEDIRRVWKLAVYSQLFFIVFLELGVPALVMAGIIDSWRVGTLDTWALGFLGASLGIAPIIMKSPKPPVV